MRTMVVVVVLPFTQLLIDQVDVIGDAVLIQQLVELLVSHRMRALDFAVSPRRAWADVDMPDVHALDVPVEL